MPRPLLFAALVLVMIGVSAGTTPAEILSNKALNCETLKALKALYILFFLIKLKTLEAI